MIFQRIAIFLCTLGVATTLASPAPAQSWSAGPAATPVLTIGALGNCSMTWYAPSAITYPNGDIGFYAQGNSPGSGIASDSIFSARQAGGVWYTPGASSLPALTGLYMAGGAPQNCGYSPSNPAPLAAPKIVFLPEAISGVRGGRYYMAFVGGNGDAIRGQVYWAFSDDGANWTTFKWAPLPAGFSWHPLVGPLNGPAGFSPDPTCAPYGITQLSLSYDPDSTLGPHGGFYLHLAYKHWAGGREVVVYRFRYDPSNGFGIGGNGQIYQCDPLSNACNWVSHSGQLVWDYDANPAPAPGDPLLRRGGGSLVDFGAGDLQFVPDLGLWLQIGYFNGRMWTQTASSLARQDWSGSTPLERSRLYSSLATTWPQFAPYGFPVGLFQGNLNGQAGLWGLFPVSYLGCPGFGGLGIVYAPLASTSHPSQLFTVPPCRLLDTRTTGNPLRSGERLRTISAAGFCGIPAGAQAVVVNVSVVSPTAPITVGLTFGNGAETGTAVVSSRPEMAARSTSAVVPLSTDGSGTLRANAVFPQAAAPASADLVIDVSGYFQ